MTLSLVLITPDQQQYRLNDFEYSIGSSTRCDIVLTGRGVEPIHARLRRMLNGSYTVEPAITAPVLVNGSSISQATVIGNGSILTIGQASIRCYTAETSQDDMDIIDADFEEIRPASTSKSSQIVAVDSRYADLIPYDPDRLGCAFCFRTLDPQDPEPDFREAVKLAGIHFHRICWERSPQHGDLAEPFVPPAPPQLKMSVVVAAPLNAGPLNTLYDVPLGISRGMVSLDGNNPIDLLVRNNSNSPFALDRRRMPPWAYVEYGLWDAVSERRVLAPHETARLWIYPHLIHPDLERVYLPFSHTRGVDVESRSRPWISSVVLIALYILLIWHWSTMLGFERWYWFSKADIRLRTLAYTLPPALFTLSVLFVLLILLMPARMLWRLYDGLDWLETSRVGDTLAPLVQRAKAFISSCFSSGAVSWTMQHFHRPLSYLFIGMGIASAIVFMGLLVFLTGVFGGFLADVMIWLEMGCVLYLLYRFGLDYGFDLWALVCHAYGRLKNELQPSRRTS